MTQNNNLNTFSVRGIDKNSEDSETNKYIMKDIFHKIKESQINHYVAENKIETTTHDLIIDYDIKTGSEKNGGYSCKSCDENFAYFIGWYRHYNKYHNTQANNKNDETTQVDTCVIQNVRNEKSVSTSVPAGQKKDKHKSDKNKILVKKTYYCRHCEGKFTAKSARNRHEKKQHPNLPKKLLPGKYNKCLDCQIIFQTREELRKHLQDHHDFDMSPVCLYFSKREEFYMWKSSMERETLSSYQRKLQSKSEAPTLVYYCARSGKKWIKKDRVGLKNYQLQRSKDSLKLGIACTAEIIAQLFGNEVIVKHYPVHYGHGEDKIIRQLSPEEQSAVDELTEKGFDSAKLLEELSFKESVDVCQMFPIRKRCLKWVKYAYKAEDFNTDMSDLECVSDWVKKCSDMEECPVLFCLQENIAMENEKFILVIMTEFQRQIIISASKTVICVDVIFRKSDVHLITILVIDELMTAFPVAYCLSNKLNKDVIKQFFACIKEYAGNLSPEYLMTNHNLYFFESWFEVMNNSPKWVWNRWDTEGSIVDHLRVFVKKDPPKRRELYDMFQTILNCNSKDVVMHLFKRCVDKIQQDEKINKLGEWAVRRLGSDFEKWAMCFQKEINTSTVLNLDVMHHILFSCGTLGKGKRLYTFLSVLMKVLRHKILDRILNSFDEEKINLAVNAIDFCHAKGLVFPSEKIVSLSNNLWMIQLDELNKVYVTQDLDKCPDHCSLRCKQCEICVHQFSCSCVNNMIDANLCLHIHAVVYKFLRPNKYQYTPTDKLFNLDANNSKSVNRTLDSSSRGPYITSVSVQSAAGFSPLQEPFAASETDQSAVDFSPPQNTYLSSENIQSAADFPSSQTTNSILVTSTAKNIPVQSPAYHSSQVLVSASSQPHFVSTKISNESLLKFFEEKKSKDNSAQKSRFILKRKFESTSVEMPLKINKISDGSAFKEIVLEKIRNVPHVNDESTNMSSETASEKNTELPQVNEKTNMVVEETSRKSEAKDMALKNTTTLFQILRTKNLSKNSLIAINKCLNECISIACNDKKEIIKIPSKVPINAINAVYVIKPQKTILEVLPSLKQS